MDKKRLNNEIVYMRPDATRAKVHVISKLSREIKSLRILKDFYSEAQKQKRLEKAERLVEEVLLIKKFKHDDISKFAVSHTKSTMTAMLSKPSTSPELRSLCRIGLHSGLMARVEKLRTQFPNGEATLASLIASIGVKVKRRKVIEKSVKLLKEDKQKTEDERLQSDSDSASSEKEFSIRCGNASGKITTEEEFKTRQDSSEVSSEDEVDSGQDKFDSSNDSSTEEEIKTQVTIQPKLKNVLPVPVLKIVKDSSDYCIEKADCDIKHRTIKNKNLKQKLVGRKCNALLANANDYVDVDVPETEPKKLRKRKEKEENTEVLDGANKRNSRPNKKEVKKPPISHRSKEMKVIRFAELLGANTAPTEQLAVTSDKKIETITTKTVDSFFVKEDGKSAFLSTVSEKEPSEEKQKNNCPSEPVYDHSGRRLNRREIRAQLYGKKGFKSFTSGAQNYSDMNKKPLGPNKLTISRWKDPTSKSQEKMLVSPPEEPLHPSWEAKKKQKEQLNIVFQGKKIKFDE